MKRFLSTLLVAMLLVTCLATAAFAAGNATVTASNVTAKPGDTVTVTYTVAGEFANYELYVKADSALTLTAINGVIHNLNTGKVAFADVSGENISSHSFTATFKLDENAKCGTYKVYADVIFVSDRDLVDQNVTVTAGKVTVNHAWDDGKVTTEPTCTEKGVKTYTCSICGETKTESIDPHGHKENTTGIVTKEATCTENGTKVFTCMYCDMVIRTEVIPATGHAWDDGKVTKEPDCTEAGEKTFTCKVCGETKTEPVDALGHDYVMTSGTATCTEPGWVTYTCSRCGDSYTEQDSPALGHAHELVDSKAPTCTEAGFETYKCPRCGDTYSKTLNALGHDWCEDFECEHEHEHYDEEYHWFLCLVCGETKDAERHDHCIEKEGYLFCKCGHWIEVDEPGIDPEPKPGDYSLLMFGGFAALIAMMAAAAYVYKRKFAK